MPLGELLVEESGGRGIIRTPNCKRKREVYWGFVDVIFEMNLWIYVIVNMGEVDICS